MRNALNVLFIIIAVIIGLQILKVVFSLSFALLRLAIPIAIVGFAIYGVSQYLKNR